MTVDTRIPAGQPGVVSFATEIFGNAYEPLMDDDDISRTNITITATGALVLPLYSVIAADGTLATSTAGVSNAFGILMEPIAMVNTQVMTVPVARSGHWNQLALNFDATFTTDALKQKAFESSKSPTIFVSKPKFSDNTIRF